MGLNTQRIEEDRKSTDPLKYTSIEIIQSEKQREKIIFEKWTKPQIYETIWSDNLHVIGEPRKEERM